MSYSKSENLCRTGLLVMARWANSWVENQTAIPEARYSELSPDEAAALALIGALLATDKGQS